MLAPPLPCVSHSARVSDRFFPAGSGTGASAYKTGRDIPTAAAARGGRSALSGARWAPAGAARRAFTAAGGAINPHPDPAAVAGPRGFAGDQKQRSPVRAAAAAAAAATAAVSALAGPAVDAAQPAGFADPPTAAAAGVEFDAAAGEQPGTRRAAESSVAGAGGPGMAGPAGDNVPDPAEPPAAPATVCAQDSDGGAVLAAGPSEQATGSGAAGAEAQRRAAGEAPSEQGPGEGDPGKAGAAPGAAAASSAGGADAPHPGEREPKPAAAAGGGGGGIGGLGANLVSTVRSFLPFAARAEPADAVPAAGKKPVKVPPALLRAHGDSMRAHVQPRRKSS